MFSGKDAKSRDLKIKQPPASAWKRAAVIFASTALLLCALMIAAAVIVDPFFHYHRPLKNFPYVVDNQLLQNPGMAANLDYDSVITGSSMTINFNTNDFAQYLGDRAVKLSSNGALPMDISNVLTVVFNAHTYARKKNAVKDVFIALDLNTYTAGVNDTKYPQPSYMYDSNPLNDISYVLNKDVFINYVVRPMAEREPTDLATVYSTDWADGFYYNEEWVMSNYTPADAAGTKAPEDERIEGTKKNLEANILPYIKRHPETTFYFFLPPYSILWWHDAANEGQLEALFSQTQYVADTLLACPNVRLFDFQNETEITENLNNYMDIEHFSPEISSWMVQRFADGRDEVKKGEISRYISNTRRMIKDFDYNSLFARYNIQDPANAQ